MLNLIENRIAPIIEQQLSDSLYGFRAGRGTRDANHAICQLRIMVERCLEMQKKHYICFIDYTKAFDRVKHDLLFEILSKAGIPNKEININKMFYLQQKATVRCENETSEEITIKRGVRQGCIIVTMSIQHLHGILDKRSTGGRKWNKHQWTKYHKHEICR